MPTTKLSLEDLYTMPDDEVRTQVISNFKSQLKASQPVKNMFFPKTSCQVQPQNTQFVSHVAIALAGSAIATCSLYDFHSTVNGGKCKSYWTSALTGDQGAAESRYLYDTFFGNGCSQNGITFSQYQDDTSQNWGKQFADYLVTDEHINLAVSKLIAGDENWNAKLNLMLYKLNRLDSALYQKVLTVFQNDIGQFVLQFPTANYFNAGMLTQDMYSAEVNSAAAVVKSEYIPTPGAAATNYIKEYGGKLWEFIKGGPKSLGLTTGVKPKNQGLETCTAYGCHTSMSRALKATRASVELKSFSDLKQGEKLFNKSGEELSISDESSLIKTHAPLWIYGINEMPPFFTAETAFQTPEGGWKSLLPQVTNQINPNLKATLLREGDEILRVVSTDPIKHESLKVTKITQELLPAGSMIARPLFNEVPTYHVEGLLVALNAPTLTPSRLAGAVRNLNPDEQKKLFKGLNSLMPLLVKAMGPYIEAPIVAAFKNAK